MYRNAWITTAVVAIAMASPVAPAMAKDDATKSASDPSKRVCRNLMLTGSRMTKRFCQTQAEWDAQAERARRQLESGQLNGSSRDGQNIPNK